MKMTKLNLMLLLLMISGFSLKAQDSLYLKLDTVKYIARESLIEVELTFQNKSNNTKRFYNPNLYDICYGLLYIHIESLTDTSFRHSIFPCKFKSDLGQIVLTDSNSIYIKGKEQFRKNLTVTLANVPKKLIINGFKMMVSLNYSYGDFISNFKNTFRGSIESNEIDIPAVRGFKSRKVPRRCATDR